MSLPCARVQASGNPSALWKELGGGAVGSLASSPGGSEGKESTCNAGDLSSIPGWGRSPGEGNSYPLQYSVLENPMGEEPDGLKSIRSQELDTT